ncbi:Hosl-1 [Aphelenchoides besseyi]|nr:Hosl-1 [Aphelenchoides besseyi]
MQLRVMNIRWFIIRLRVSANSMQTETHRNAIPTVVPRKVEIGPRILVERDGVFRLLKLLADENHVYFDANRTKSMYYQRIAECCSEIHETSEMINDLMLKMQEAARKCDYDEHTPGNGFRSLICVCDMVALHLVAELKKCSETRNSLLFQSTTVCKDLENYVAILRFFALSFQQVVLLTETLDENSLFPSLDCDYSLYHGMLKGIEGLDASCFYGRTFGFQFAPSVTSIFNVIGIILATYSLSWESGTAAFSSLLHSGRYFLNPEERARRIIKVTREADLEFCRDFWNLSEIPPPKLFCPTMEINKVVLIPMDGPIRLDGRDGRSIEIPEPGAHGPSAPIQVRILSATSREGLSSKKSTKPLSSNLLLHCHGGGYVATSSKSHETYLRLWAKYLDCPIVSVDYSLAPQFPFPRPTEEVLYAYAWILKNPEKFGWDGKKLLMVGDSAGGNLIVSVALRLAQLKAARMPDGLIPIYTPFLFQYLPSPSRVLSFTDPLLHMGIVIRCAAAYTDCCPNGTRSEITSNSLISQRGHKSLLEYVDEVKAKHLVDSADCNFESQSILSLMNLSNMSVPSSPLNGQTLVATKNRSTDEATREGEPKSLNNSIDETNTKESEEQHGENENATVYVNRNPSYLSLSTCNYDQTLIDYLQSHPLTKTNLAADDNVFESENGQNAVEVNAGPRLFNCTTPNTPSLSKTMMSTMTASVSVAFDKIVHYIETPTKPIGHADKPKLTRAATAGIHEAARAAQKEAEKVETSLSELLKLNLPRDCLISPMYTPDELLRELPTCRFISCHLDPLLDDTITFAKKLRNAGGRVASLDLLDGLPHGFLNFVPMSADCYEGARICVQRIKEAFESL